MAQLPTFTNGDRTIAQMSTQWKAILDPVIAQPQPTILKKIKLNSGTNFINHLLGQNLQGWYIVRQRAAASIYDSQDNNPNPSLTLALVSSASCVVDIAVY